MLTVDPGLPEPPYEQIKTQIVAARASGAFPAGHRLPPVRHLAVELGLAPNTVARAYRELEADGIIATRGRAGSFVTATSEGADRALDAAARVYLARARELGAGVPEALQALQRAAAAAGPVG